MEAHMPIRVLAFDGGPPGEIGHVSLGTIWA